MTALHDTAARTTRVLFCAALTTVPVHAQSVANASRDSSAIFRGRVIRIDGGAPIAGADLWVISSDRHASTDSTGAFRLDDLHAGLVLLEVRRLGFDVRRDTVLLSPSHDNVRTYALAASAATLDTVRTLAEGGISPRMRAFDERMRMGFGHFITDSVFRRNENTSVAGIIESRIPGVTALGGKTLVSSRKGCMGLAFEHPHNCQASGAACYVTIYLNGALYYTPPPTDTVAPPTPLGAGAPDMTRAFRASDFQAAEYYADGATAPAGMHSNDQGCGTLWLWTRER